jgi:hypothetical protein
MAKELPKIIFRKDYFWNSEVELRRWDLEKFVRLADGKYIVAYTEISKRECLAICIGNSYAECEKEMRSKLSQMKFVKDNYLESKHYERPWLSRTIIHN